MEKKQDQNKLEIKIQPLNIRMLRVPIIGKTPLLMDKLRKEVLIQIMNKQTGKAKSGNKDLRNLDLEFQGAIHKTSKGIIGYPVAGFKGALINACSFCGDRFFSKKLISGGIRIINSIEGLIPLKYSKICKLEHNIGANTKITPLFEDWSCELVIQYDGNNISAEDIIKLINYAGFYIGVGSWRPKCRDGGSGEYGTFEVKLKNGA